MQEELDTEDSLVRKAIYDFSSRILHSLTPAGYEAPVIGKYWGAIYKILAEKDGPLLQNLNCDLSEFSRLLRDIQRGVQAGEGSLSLDYHVPRPFQRRFDSYFCSSSFVAAHLVNIP